MALTHLPTTMLHHLSSPSPRIRSSVATSCLKTQTNSAKVVDMTSLRKEYTPGIVDDVFLNIFRSKMAQEGGWDSERPGYDGLIDCARRLIVGRSKPEASEIAVRILVSLFPPLLLELYKKLIAPIDGGKVAAEMMARVTAISCQWLMGTCTVNSVDIAANGTSWSSGVFVEKCKYLEGSKCVGVCIHTCKLPTQTFIKEYMGVPLLMEPNFNDYSCQFKFGVHPPSQEDDSAVKEPCLQICPTYNRRKELSGSQDFELKCPNA